MWTPRQHVLRYTLNLMIRDAETVISLALDGCDVMSTIQVAFMYNDARQSIAQRQKVVLLVLRQVQRIRRVKTMFILILDPIPFSNLLLSEDQQMNFQDPRRSFDFRVEIMIAIRRAGIAVKLRDFLLEVRVNTVLDGIYICVVVVDVHRDAELVAWRETALVVAGRSSTDGSMHCVRSEVVRVNRARHWACQVGPLQGM